MRTLLFLSVLLIPTTAFTAEREAFVKSDEVSLLAGPGTNMPETARLRRGARIRVHHEEGDYFAVQPPAGCISWVRMNYLQFVKTGESIVFPSAAVVDANGLAKLKAGRVGEAKPLGVERIAVPDGTVLTVVGQKVEIDGVKWYPVAAPEDDFRYILKTTVELGNAIESKYVVTSPNNGPTGTATPAILPLPTASIPAPVGSNWNHPRWIEAQRAERAGDLDLAEKIYLDLAKEMNKPGGTEKLAEDCYARVHDIRERRRRASGRTSMVTPTPDRRDGAKRDVTMVSAVTPSKSESTESETPRWEGPGTLYTSALRFNGEKLFALQSNPKSVMTYAIAGKGVDLARQTNQSLRLYGTVVPLAGYPGQTVMTVTRVEQAK